MNDKCDLRYHYYRIKDCSHINKGGNTQSVATPSMPGGHESTPSKGSNVHRPRVLEGGDLASVAKYIKSHKCRNIVFMVRALC